MIYRIYQLKAQSPANQNLFIQVTHNQQRGIVRTRLVDGVPHSSEKYRSFSDLLGILPCNGFFIHIT